MPVKLNSLAHPRALLVLHGRDILAHVTSVTEDYSSNLAAGDWFLLAAHFGRTEHLSRVWAKTCPISCLA
jgi:hypothetical protein